MPAKKLNVDTGEVKVGGEDTILKSNTIGSCIVIAAYDTHNRIGGLAYVMLPGSDPGKPQDSSLKYTVNAVEELMNKMTGMGTRKENIEAFLVGGGNVLKKEDDNICQKNISSVVKILNNKNITIRKTAVGGTVRRTVLFDIKNGSLNYTEDGSPEMLLWKRKSI